MLLGGGLVTEGSITVAEGSNVAKRLTQQADDLVRLNG
jgi:hypothetical protein